MALATLQYSKYVLDELYRARKEVDQCDLKVIYDDQDLHAHSVLLETVSMLVRGRTFSAAEDTVRLHEILIPHNDDFACYDCTSKLIDALYAHSVQEIETGHESHAENLINFFQIIDIVQEYLYDTLLTGIPKDKRKYIAITKPTNSSHIHKETILSKDKIKKSLKIKTPNKTLSAKMQACIECELSCYKPADMLAHVMKTKHGRNVCSLCSVSADSHKQFEEHLKKHDHDKPFFCTTCDARFQTRTLWSQHLPTHSTLAPFRCPHCPKAFKWKHGLNGHLIIHTKEKKHLCDECGFSTTHAKTLRAHKLTHSGDMFRCSHPGCAHTSVRKENMKIHMKTHSKEKPYVCEICGLNFTLNKNLQRHSLIHSQGEVNQIHSCTQCSFKALRTDNLKAHILRQHTDTPLNRDTRENFTDDNSGTVQNTSSGKSDLIVLADAASCCSRIIDSVLPEEIICTPTF